MQRSRFELFVKLSASTSLFECEAKNICEVSEEIERRTSLRMDCRSNSDVFFLPDEKFDFDVSLSPASSRGDEDEDEVFVGPVSHKEKCVSVSVASPLENHSITWSPLTGEQLEAVCQEAHRLASQLQSTVSHDENRDTTSLTMDTMTEQEEFVEDAETRLGLLAQTTSGVSPNKRQTFCVQDSPLKQLPPVIQRQLQRGSGSSITSSIRPTITPASSTRPTSKSRLSTCSPVIQAKAQPRTALRGKSALGVAVVLPSKPTIPVTSCSTNKSRVEKTKLQPPKRAVGSWRRSSSSCPPTRAESSEDLLSDSASVASDISDSSLNSSLLGKRTLPRPTKQSGVRNLSGGKAQPLQTRRKNTSSSSSSVSSFNSSISLSPAKGKVKSTLNGSLSSSTGPAPRNVNSLSRPRRSTIYSAAETVSSSAAGRRSISTQVKKLSEAESGKDAKSTPHKRAEATPPKRPASNLTSSTSRLQSGPKAKSKPEAVVLPTPSTAGKGVHHANDVSKVLKPKRLMSLNGMDSLLQKPSAGPLTPSAITCKSLQMKPRRPSALPTPVRRKASLIPSPTPKPPALSDSVPTSYTKQHSCSPTLTNAEEEEEEEELVDAPEIQPFCLEDDPPTTTPSNSQQADQSEPIDPRAQILDESVPNENLLERELKEDSNSKIQEVLLLDLTPPTLAPQEKLLIDLTNTPDLIRTNNKTCNATQLIDLSSPLIKWSPEDKAENNAPLINLSF